MLFKWKASPTATLTDHWMISVKFAPKDAPDIGKGHWTWPIQSLCDTELLEEVIKHGITIQERINKLNQREIDWDQENLQTLWEEFKTDIQKIVKSHTNKIKHKTALMIKNLERDIRKMTKNANFDNNDKLRTEEAYLENKLSHMIKVLAQNQKTEMRVNLANHGKKLGGIWTAINKDKKPCDLIH